jgi:hypothetical protein
MQATLSNDGQYRIDLRITHRVGVGQLSSILASAFRLHSLEDGPLPTLTVKATQDAIRTELVTRGGLIEGWANGMGTTETNQRMTWAEAQVRRAYPELSAVQIQEQNAARLAAMPARQTADPETVAEIHAARCRDCKGAGCPVCGYSGQDANRRVGCLSHHIADNRGQHADTLPVPACVSGTEYGIWSESDGGFIHLRDCALQAANDAAEILREDSDADEFRIIAACRNHPEQPANGCEDCHAETDEDEDE